MSADIDRIVTQLQTIKAALRVVWSGNLSDDKRIAQIIAAYLVANGTTNLLDLQHYENKPANLVFYFDKRTGFVYPNPLDIYGAGLPLTITAQDAGGPIARNLFTYSSIDSTNLAIYLVFTPDGYPVFVSRGTPQSSDWVDFMHIVLFVAASVIGYAFPALGASIGNAVLGPQMAAAYPAVATSLGNIAVQTALNGGNIQAAVAGSLTGAAGSSVGGIAANATNSVIIGQVAASATQAAISGGDISQAVVGALVQSGIRNASDAGALVQTASLGKPMGMFDSINQTNAFADPGNTINFGDITTGAASPDTSGVPATSDNAYGLPSIGDMQPGGSMAPWSGWSALTDMTTPVNLNPVNQPPSGPSGVVANTGGVDLTQLAMTGLKLVQAWQQAGKPAPRIGNSSSRPNADGTLTQVVNGKQMTAPLPAGTPYLMSNGSLVTNNGDGTYTTVASNGAVSVSHYGATGINSNMLLIVGGVLVAFLLMKGR